MDTQVISYHTAGTLNQPVSSGSLAVYGRAQGYDDGTLTGTEENFTGEDFRIKLLNNVTAFNGTAWDTTYQVEDFLGQYDLQVKPGFLVDPGGARGYWYPSGYGAQYKYYIRRFKVSGTKTQLTIDVGQSLEGWETTNNGYSMVVIFKSATSGGSRGITTCRFYDPTQLNDNAIDTTGIGQDFHINPFSSNIHLYGNYNGTYNSGTKIYTMPLRNPDGMYLDLNETAGTGDGEYYIMIRCKDSYTGTPISQIEVGY